ncbi:uncharacterized protein [Dermacentor albipictus]|uniref:uncharacterized protein n=1 Tax=Dermacentor albipictus TaxID=60249 RepID=UPI0038FD1407
MCGLSLIGREDVEDGQPVPASTASWRIISKIARKSRDGDQPSVTMGHQAAEVPDPVVCTAASLNEGVLESTTMDEGDSGSSTTARMGLASEATASGSAVSPAAAHTGPPQADELFCVVNGQVLVGESLHMPENKWQYIMKSRGDAKCVLDVARHLWTQAEAGERSLTGQACRTMSESSGKLAATPAKVDAVKNCLEKYVALHPSGPAAPPAEHRVAAVRKHLRSFFTEAARQGKRVRQPKRAEASLPDGHPARHSSASTPPGTQHATRRPAHHPAPSIATRHPARHPSPSIAQHATRHPACHPASSMPPGIQHATRHPASPSTPPGTQHATRALEEDGAASAASITGAGGVTAAPLRVGSEDSGGLCDAAPDCVTSA